jgi:hypothetical protein
MTLKHSVVTAAPELANQAAAAAVTLVSDETVSADDVSAAAEAAAGAATAAVASQPVSNQVH